MFSYFEPNFIEKFLWENAFSFFQIFAKIEMTRNENRLFGRHFETTQYFPFFFFLRIAIFYNPYIYGTNFIAKFRWESGFIRGFHETPLWAPTGVKVTWSPEVLALCLKMHAA